jgi:hypothetical protein
MQTPAPAPAPQPGQPAQPMKIDPSAAQAPGTPVGPDVKREPPPLNADPNIMNLGFLEPETTKVGKTTLKNTGAEPLTIRSVSSSCSCTIPKDLSGTILKPGDTVELEASLKAGKFPGPMQRAVRVFVDGYGVPIQVWVNADVSYGVRAMPTFVDCFQTTKGRIEIEATDGQKFSILSVNGEAPKFDGFDPAKDEPATKYTLTYDYSDQIKEDPTKLPKWWLVETDHPKAPVVDLRLIHPAIIEQQAAKPAAPWTMMEDRVLIGAMKAGEAKEFTFTLHRNAAAAEDPKWAGTKPELATESGNLKFEAIAVEEQSDGIHIKMKVTAKESMKPGLVMERADIKWKDNDGKIWMFGRVMGGPKADASR